RPAVGHARTHREGDRVGARPAAQRGVPAGLLARHHGGHQVDPRAAVQAAPPLAPMSRPLRLLFWACCAWAVAAMWLAPHLPQIDLPQHAGQTALLREFALGRTPWPGELRVNLLTPYLIVYGALLGLAFVMSIESAIA